MVESDKRQIKQQRLSEPDKESRSSKITKPILSSVIVILVLVIGYFGYGYFSNLNSIKTDEKTEAKPPRILQMDVLNGCGVKGIGSKFTDYLRAHGFDVVESKNYKTFQVARTLIIDRIGDLAAARRVASALGVKERNIIQQINPDYFVDVSVVIGKDYSELNISQK
jgi:hypothetical protein